VSTISYSCESIVTRARVQKAVPSIKEIPIILADVFDEPAMTFMCRSTTLLINCTGPYRLYGEPVIRACVAAGTHYLDITGEPQFIEMSMLRYHDEAVKNGSLVVNSCGFDSIPSDLGVVFATEQFPSDGCCSTIETFISFEGKRGHATTYECAVLGLGATDDLKALRKSQQIKVKLLCRQRQSHQH
jgi:short subunit dehydrogenase-like uncharacterized protein